MDKLQEPGALDAITKDCVDATAEYGRDRFETVLAELVRTVKQCLAGPQQ